MDIKELVTGILNDAVNELNLLENSFTLNPFVDEDGDPPPIVGMHYEYRGYENESIPDTFQYLFMVSMLEKYFVEPDLFKNEESKTKEELSEILKAWNEHPDPFIVEQVKFIVNKLIDLDFSFYVKNKADSDCLSHPLNLPIFVARSEKFGIYSVLDYALVGDI